MKRFVLGLIALLLCAAPATPQGIYGNAFVAQQANPALTTGTCAGSAPKLNTVTFNSPLNIGPSPYFYGVVSGNFTLAVCAAGTVILSGLPASLTGWACEARDLTTTADTLTPKSSTTTTFTFNPVTAVASDLIQVICNAF